MLRRLKICGLLLLLSFLATGVVCGVALLLGNRLCAPAMMAVERPVDLPIQDVQIESASGSTLAGWLLEADESRGSILLLHGVRANRGDMIGLMRFFHAFHYDVLAIDFQAHGESPGERITFGHLESLDAAAAVDFLWKRDPNGPVFVFGRSLGGASAIMAPYKKQPTALIVEAAFSDIETAIGNRFEMRLGEWGRALTPLLSCQFKPRLGVSAADISPLEAMTNIDEPILIIYGEEDEHCRPAEALALIAAARGPVETLQLLEPIIIPSIVFLPKLTC